MYNVLNRSTVASWHTAGKSVPAAQEQLPAAPHTVRVDVLFAVAPRRVLESRLVLPDGSTLADAVRASGLLQELDAASVDALQTAVWGRRVAPMQVLSDGDRVELCRPLRVDPKMARRERFVRQGARGTGLFSHRRAGAKSGY